MHTPDGRTHLGCEGSSYASITELVRIPTAQEFRCRVLNVVLHGLLALPPLHLPLHLSLLLLGLLHLRCERHLGDVIIVIVVLLGELLTLLGHEGYSHVGFL
jgi:hypothetical protein